MYVKAVLQCIRINRKFIKKLRALKTQDKYQKSIVEIDDTIRFSEKMNDELKRIVEKDFFANNNNINRDVVTEYYYNAKSWAIAIADAGLRGSSCDAERKAVERKIEP